MTKEMLFSAIGGINNEYVEQAWSHAKKNRTIWKRLWPAAACFGLAAVITFSVLANRPGTDSLQDTLDSYTVSFVRNKGEEPTVINLSYSDIAGGENSR